MWHLTLHRWTGERAPHLMNDHYRWMYEQQQAGNVLFSGPTPDRSMGIIVFAHHLDGEQVAAACATEPLVAGGHRSVEVIPWDVHQVMGIGAFSADARRAVEADEASQELSGRAGPV